MTGMLQNINSSSTGEIVSNNTSVIVKSNVVLHIELIK